MLRVRASRWLARRFLGFEEMLCARASWHAHWSEPYIDALFWWDGPAHCRRAADWEARQERGEPDWLDYARQVGWL